jgi:F0F1-type ATP synthase membrane subunit b/b'
MFKIKESYWNGLTIVAFLILMFYALTARIEKINNERSQSSNRLQDFVIR